MTPASPSRITEDDLYLFNEGSLFRAYDKLGAHLEERGGERGCSFAVWAPNAERVSVMGDFNGWSRGIAPLRPRGVSGIWEGFLPGVRQGALYKYHVQSRHDGYRADKADPCGFLHETPPRTASVVWDLAYDWGDRNWMRARARRQAADAPISIYEVHLGSWMRAPDQPQRFLGYRDLAPRLAEHAVRMGFTHVELMPVMEHPFYGSWGYQVTGYFAPTSRHGTPQDFMHLVDTLHQAGIGVILDWVPSHFPNDAHGLAYFDGTHLYEHADPRLGFHPDWSSCIFNYGRNEVRSFLISSALFWLDRYHADGLRVDAVASMLYRDYSRKPGEWIPNQHGGRENLEAIALLRRMNEEVKRSFPGAATCAEESTAWPGVSRPAAEGGLGFDYKWDMGWMHDTLRYLARDPVHRRHHQDELTFRGLYAFTENYILSLSHDECVHGKRSLLEKMPGDDWQKFANLRLLYGYMFALPGKKLLFMGGELAQRREWTHEESLDWHLLEHESHRGVREWLAHLNRLYQAEPALHRHDCEPAGFEWLDTADRAQSVLSFVRKGQARDPLILVACNFTPLPRHNYRLGAPSGGFWREIGNSDATQYWGSGQGNLGGVQAVPVPAHGRSHSLTLTLPPLGVLILRHEGTAR
ncbi:MAG: 1,4-alpha-glucan branching protein GlgB [Planctomycetota bacterium]|nr:MAG: 1,4-alpha-glucan branching protein GlgB [Planctomycetota bacterium]